jgi:hypothetical protein
VAAPKAEAQELQEIAAAGAGSIEGGIAQDLVDGQVGGNSFSRPLITSGC